MTHKTDRPDNRQERDEIFFSARTKKKNNARPRANKTNTPTNHTEPVTDETKPVKPRKQISTHRRQAVRRAQSKKDQEQATLDQTIESNPTQPNQDQDQDQAGNRKHHTTTHLVHKNIEVLKASFR